MASKKKGPDPSADEELTFEEAIERLEAVVGELEGGELTLDESLARYEEGRRVIGRCYALLEGAERRIEALIKGASGALQVEAFADPEPEETREP